MNQQSLLNTAEKYIPGACLGMLRLPEDIRMVMVRGEGSKLYDAEDREYIDYMLGSGPLLLGHAHPEIVEAVKQQAASGSTFFALSEPAVQLAETLVTAVPCGEAVRYQTTGSAATYFSLRIARAATGRNKVLKFEGGWHGSHDMGQLSAAPSDPPDFPQAAPDCAGISPGVSQEVLVAPFNDPQQTAAIIDAHQSELAAVIVEPLQRVLKPEPGFLESLREATAKAGIILIFDEIVTGFRIAWGGAQERYGVLPDLACYGKAMSGGYPLSAIVGRRDLLDLADPIQRQQGDSYCFLSGTLTGNPIASAAGVAALKVLKGPGVFDRFHAIGAHLATGITEVADRLGIALRVLGEGPVLQVLFTDRQQLRDHRDMLHADKKKAVQFGYELIRRGVYCSPGGKLYLSLAHSDEDLDRTIEIAEDALKALG